VQKISTLLYAPISKGNLRQLFETKNADRINHFEGFTEGGAMVLRAQPRHSKGARLRPGSHL